MSDKYILVGHTPVPCPWLLRWARWFETADRHVRDTMQDDVRVSTVFLGLDHSFSDHGPPMLFETMVFVNGSSVDCERYATWDEAEAGHQRWVMQVFKPTRPYWRCQPKETRHERAARDGRDADRAGRA